MKSQFRELFVFPLLLISSFMHSNDYSKDLENILSVSNKLVQEELRKDSKPCQQSFLNDFSNVEEESQSKISVFISSSVPVESWKAHSKVLEKIGGQFVLRGMPKNSLKEFVKYVQTLNQKGILAPITVDANAFEKHDIQSVPAIVLSHFEKSDKITGNIPIRNALEIFSSKGSLKSEAKQLIYKLDRSWDLR